MAATTPVLKMIHSVDDRMPDNEAVALVELIERDVGIEWRQP